MLESFFEWSDSQGLPFRSWADALEEKGIPAVALFLIPLLLIGGGAFFFLSQGPVTGSVVISATTFAGEPLSGVSITLTNEGDFKASGATDSGGKLVFEKVPVGSVHAVAFSQSVALLEPSFDLVVKAGLRTQKSISASLQEAQGVNLVVDVQAASAPTLTLLDSSGKVVDKVAEQTSYSFSVAKNTAYVVRAEQDGFLSDEQRVEVGESNRYVTLLLQEKGKTTDANLHVRVVEDGPAGGPLANASVRVFQGEALLRSAESSEDGSVPPLLVSLGASVRVVVSREGFSEASVDVNVSRLDQSVDVALDRLAPAFSGVRITVKDSAGNTVFSPVVRLYSGLKFLSEQLPDEGVALFNVSWSSSLGVSVYKAGFLPVFLPSVKKDQLVVLNSSDEKSARVRVHVSDRRGEDAARVSVLLLDGKSRPLGVPARLTDESGVQVFDDVPLVEVRADVSGGVHRMVSDSVVLGGLQGLNETLIEVQFDPLSVKVPVRVVDHYSRQPISGAKVVSSDQSCTTNSKGVCALAVLESDSAVFSVSALEYSSLVSASFAVFPGLEPLLFELTPARVAQNVRLRFDGVFDVSGRKVSSLSPLSEYEARYVIVSPGVEFAKAEAQVALEGSAALLGGQGSGARVSKGSLESRSLVAEVPPVSIGAEGFSQAAFEVEQGGVVAFVNEDNATHVLVFDDGQSVSVPEGQNRSVVFNKVGGFSFKSMRNPQLTGFVTVVAKASADVADASDVLFEYGPFNGSRAFSLRFKTGSSGEVVLRHRSAFFTSLETLKSPEDGLSESARLKISFAGGTCTESVCVQWFFLQEGKQVSRLELPLGKSGVLKVNVVGLARPGVISVAPSTLALKVLSASSNSSLGVSFANNTQVRASAGSSAAEFSFQGIRLSQDSSLKLLVLEGSSVVFEAEAFVVVFSKTQPALVVSVKPNKVEALLPSKVVFTVKDSLGQVVEGARVSLGELEAVESGNSSGIYVVDEVQPESLASIPFEVTKEGFKPFSGAIAVEPPEQAVDASPSALTITVDSKEPASSSLQLSNKLADKLRASVSFTVQSGGQITEVSTSSNSVALPARGSATLDLKAAIKQDVLALALKVGQIKEKTKGTLHLRVSAKGGFSETIDVPFTIDSAFSQSAIGDAWTVSPDSLQFNLDPPKVKSQDVELTVANSGPYPMVFNVEQTLGLSVQPASLTLDAGAQDSFKVKAFLPREIDCFSQDLQKKGALTIYGSFQGLSSKKTAQVNLDVSTASLACQPPDGYRLTLPVDVRLEFLANSRTKTNPDGSTSVLLPTRDLLWFGSGASVTPVDAQVPQGTEFVFARRFVQPLAEGGWSIAFPTAVTLNLPSEADYQPFGSSGQTVVTIENAQIILPAGVQTPQSQAQVGTFARPSAVGSVRVPPMAPVVFRRIPFNYDALQNLLPADPLEIKLPSDATFDLLPGTVERKFVQPKTPNSLLYLPRPQAEQNLQNLKAIQLPNGERIAFGDAVGLDLNQFRATLPAGTSLFVSRLRVNEVKNRPLSEAFELRMPMSYALAVAGTTKPFKTQEGKNALKIKEDAVVEASWALSVSKQQSSQVLRVARENALTFLSGASATIPYDPASVAKCSFTYAPPDTVAFSLPAGTVVQKTSKGFEAVLPACDDTSRLVFSVSSSSGASSEVFQSPSVKKIVFPSDSDFVVGDSSDNEEKSVRTSGLIELTACLKDAAGKEIPDGLREAKVSFAENSLVSMPVRVLSGLKEGQYDLDFGVLTQVSLGSKSGSLSQLGSTKKMTVHPNGQKVKAAMPPEYPASALLMPKGSGLSFMPVCEKGSGRLDVSVNAEDVFVALDKDGKTGTLEVTFSNKNPELFNQKKEVCLFNNGAQSVLLDSVHAEPSESVAAEHKDYFKSIAGAVPGSSPPDTAVQPNKAYFSQPGAYGNRQKMPIEPSAEGKDNCRRFTLEMSLPPDVLWKDKCIDKNKVPASMSGSYVFKFNDANNDAMSSSDKHRLPVKMVFDAKDEDCQALQEQQQFQDLSSISVNYDTQELNEIGTGENKLYFKDAGHTRFFAIINNEEKTIRVKQIRGDGVGLMTCRWKDAQSGAFFDLKADKIIEPADVLLLTCTSNAGSAGKQGTYTVDFVGESYHLSKTINVHVFDPGALRSLYQVTPIGQAVPFFEAGQSTPKERSKLNVAPLQSLAFADAASSPEPQQPAPPEKTTEEIEAERKARTEANVAAAGRMLDFRLCKKFFCTQLQGNAAIQAFTQTFSELIDQRLKKGQQSVTQESLEEFCKPLQGGKYFEKSTLLQLTNVELSPDASRVQSLQLQEQLRTQYFSDMKEVVVKSTGSATLFSGCGMYRVTAKLDPACAIKGTTPEDWKRNMRVELHVSKLESCPVNLANAALLTADEPKAYSGNQLGTGSTIGAIKQVFSWNTLNAFGGLARSAFASGDKSKIAAILESVGRLRQGVLGVYGSEANDKDALAVKIAYASIYGANAKDPKSAKYCPKEGIENRPCPATPYENTDFCWRTGGPVLTTLGSVVVGTAVAQAVIAAASAPATGGSSVVLGLRSFLTNYRLITAASGCGAGMIAEKINGRSVLSCRMLESCTSSVLAGAIELANPLGFAPLAAETNLIRSTSTGAAFMSFSGSFVLQSLIGGAGVAYLERLAGPETVTTPPVVPITIILRQGLSPDKINRGMIAAKQFTVNIMPGASQAKQVETITNALAAQGIYGSQGRRTAAQAVRAFFDAGSGELEKSFENALFRGMAALGPNERKAVQKALDGKDSAAAYEIIAKQLIKEDPLAARKLLIDQLDVNDPKALQLFFSTLSKDRYFGSQTLQIFNARDAPQVIRSPMRGIPNPINDIRFYEDQKFRNYLLDKLTNKESTFLIVSNPAAPEARLLIDGGEALRVPEFASRLGRLESAAKTELVAAIIEKQGQLGKTQILPTASEIEIKTALAAFSAENKQQLLDKLKSQSEYLKFMKTTGIDGKFAPEIAEIVTEGRLPSAGALATHLDKELIQQSKKTLAELSDDFVKHLGESGKLPASSGGLKAVLESSAGKLEAKGLLRGAKTASEKMRRLSDLQLYDHDGKPVKLTPDTLADFERTVADRQQDARKLLEADKRAKFVRGAGAFAAFLSAFLFNTDFRPVQIRVMSDQANSHLIAVHSEKGRPSAESICIAGVATDSCDPNASGSGNVLSVSSLCGKTGVCMRLLQWPSGTREAYALVLGFNDDAQIDPAFLGSIFLPEKPPLLPADLQRLKLPAGISLDYQPLSKNGFPQYQPEAVNPKDTARNVQIQLAQAMIDRMNSDEFKSSLSDADRINIMTLANQAISAFRAGKDAEGLARLKQADEAEGRLLAKGLSGGKP